MSVNGAEFNLSLEQRPRIPEHANASAEGATHRRPNVQPCESRLQRSSTVDPLIPGALPQAMSEMRLWRKQITCVALGTQSQISP